MNWIDFLDAIYVISLPESKERRKYFLSEMQKYNIPAHIWPATKRSNGAKGLKETIIDIFDISVKNDFNNVLIFEDDAFFLEYPHIIMNRAIDQLPKDYDMLYLGINPFGGFDSFYSENLLKVKAGCTTHACIYSKKFMEEILNSEVTIPIDMHFADFHINGRSFATFPLLCSQRNGYSYIEKKEIDYSKYIQERYAEKVKAIA